MGSGKTTVGKKLATKLNLDFFDLDDLIVMKFNKSVNEIFASDGEDFFRKYENKLLLEISKSDNFILSVGGGTPCYNNNIDFMNSSGKTVYLQMSDMALYSRLVTFKANRPLIKDLDYDSLKLFIKSKLKEREPFYLKANIIVDALNFKINSLIQTIQDSSKI